MPSPRPKHRNAPRPVAKNPCPECHAPGPHADNVAEGDPDFAWICCVCGFEWEPARPVRTAPARGVALAAPPVAMNLQQAALLLRQGKHMTRLAWRIHGLSLAYLPDPSRSHHPDGRELFTLNTRISLIERWSPTLGDLTALDWYEVLS